MMKQNQKKYRIREYNGVFEIQIWGYKQKGMLWWKRKAWCWYRTNAWGGVRQTSPILEPSSKTCKTLQEAKIVIEEWNKGPIYHSV